MERNGTTNGFVFGACGPEYTKLANTAAKSLRGVAPDANIDLFTDCADEVEDGIFDQCHELNRSWFRPKFEAMIRSRFEKTIYADCDTYFCADVSDIFEVLDHADFAAVQVIRNNMKFNLTQWRTKLPLAVPRYNCGLIGIRNTPKVIEFLQNVEKIILEEDLQTDQPVFRELLFYGDLRVISLPYEFNFTQLTYIDILSDWFCAPRMLHFIGMREHVTNSGTRHLSVQDIVGQKRWRFLARHRRNDAYLTGNSDPSELKPLLKRGLSGWLRSLGV